jgi:hypothetical protein
MKDEDICYLYDTETKNFPEKLKFGGISKTHEYRAVKFYTPRTALERIEELEADLKEFELLPPRYEKGDEVWFFDRTSFLATKATVRSDAELVKNVYRYSVKKPTGYYHLTNEKNLYASKKECIEITIGILKKRNNCE